MKAQIPPERQTFAAALDFFENMMAELQSPEARQKTHDQIEEYLLSNGFELMRLLAQGLMDWRSGEEPTEFPVGSDAVVRTHQRTDTRPLMTIFGEVVVTRKRYSARGHTSVAPLDGALNLPTEKHSLALRRRAAIEATRGSFDEAVVSLQATTAATLAKRQAQQLVQQAAVDFEAFYATRQPPPNASTSEILVITLDGKGVVMHRDDLRPQTRKAAEKRRHKKAHRLSKGEKANSRRTATVAAVYTLRAQPRTPNDILSDLSGVAKEARPKPEHKRVWASLTREPAQVIAAALDEAERRDPERQKHWVALVDGNEHQIKVLEREAARRKVKLTIVLDIIHVIEYLWEAAHVLFAEDDPKAEEWVTDRLRIVLFGRAWAVAAGIRRSATRRGLGSKERKPIEKCARYLHKHKPYMNYHQALADGLPIATGVIEGACRHLVKDRMDLTGARWRLAGAEAVLRLRSLRASGDFDAYWRHHVQQEQNRNHRSRYADDELPDLCTSSPSDTQQPYLSLVA